MAWQNTKLDWLYAAVQNKDFNRIESNLLWLYSQMLFISDTKQYAEEVLPIIQSLILLYSTKTYVSFSSYTDLGSTWQLLTAPIDTSGIYFIVLDTGNNISAPTAFKVNDKEYTIILPGIQQPTLLDFVNNTLVLVIFINDKAFPLFNYTGNYNDLFLQPKINDITLAGSHITATLNISADNTPATIRFSIKQYLEELLAPKIGNIILTARILSEDYLLCNGQEVLQQEYLNLYAAVGTKYGTAAPGYFRLPSNNLTYHNSYIRAKLMEVF